MSHTDASSELFSLTNDELIAKLQGAEAYGDLAPALCALAASRLRSTRATVPLELLGRLQAAAEPYDGDCGDAVIPAALWREFVDAHARALYDAAHSESAPSARAVAEKCAEIVAGEAVKYEDTSFAAEAAIRAYAASLPLETPVIVSNEAKMLAEQWKDRADDCGRLSRAVQQGDTAPTGETQAEPVPDFSSLGSNGGSAKAKYPCPNGRECVDTSACERSGKCERSSEKEGSDTPRMDATLGKGADWIFAEGCRLERELAEAREVANKEMLAANYLASKLDAAQSATPLTRSAAAFPQDYRRKLEESNLPIEVATAIADRLDAAVSARAAIIEECAKVCDSYGMNPPGTTYTERLLQCHSATDCADAIRALASTAKKEGQ